jgi:hypothetical protein
MGPTPDASHVLASNMTHLPCLHAAHLGRAAQAVQACTRAAGREIEALFLEYEAGESAEARLVKDFDKARGSPPRTPPFHSHPLPVPRVTRSCLDRVALSGGASRAPAPCQPALCVADARGTAAEGRSSCGVRQPASPQPPRHWSASRAAADHQEVMCGQQQWQAAAVAGLGGLGSSLRQCAQVEMVLQAAEYEAAQGLRLQPFFSSTAGRFQTPTGRAWAAEVARRRAPPDAGAAAGAAGAPAARGPAPGAEEGRGCGGAGAAGSGSHPAAADGAPEGEGGPGHGAADAAALSAAAAAGAGARTRRSESGGAGGHAPTAGLAEAEDAPLGGAQRAEARRRREAGALAGGQARAQEPCRGGASAG